MIQDQKRNAIVGRPSRWPDQLQEEFAKLEEVSAGIPYAALDLEYLRSASHRNRSFGYVVTYDTFIAPERDDSDRPAGQPKLVSVVKLGDGGREDGYSAGKASGSIISRIVRSYWEDGNTYRPVLQGIVIPGNDTRISGKIAKEVGSRKLQLRGDVWHLALLDLLTVEDLLALLAGGTHAES